MTENLQGKRFMINSEGDAVFAKLDRAQFMQDYPLGHIRYGDLCTCISREADDLGGVTVTLDKDGQDHGIGIEWVTMLPNEFQPR